MTQDIHVLVEHLRGQVLEITYIMLAAGRKLAQASGGQVIAVMLGQDAAGLAGDLGADRVVYYEHPALKDFSPDAYLRVLSGHLQANPPRALLLGHTSVGMDLAGGLSKRLGWPLVSQCRRFGMQGTGLQFVSQFCGGKLLAEGNLPAPAALVTMVPGGYKAEEGAGAQPPVETQAAPALDGLRVRLLQYIEPEVGDVDITREALLVAVGRGLQNQDDLEVVAELAEALGGAVCASRPIVDQGWLSTARLVGKSGKTVKPKVYLCLGISGAPEHVEAITGSETIIAVNTDPNAPIFDLARYGVEADMLDVIDAMLQQIST